MNTSEVVQTSGPAVGGRGQDETERQISTALRSALPNGSKVTGVRRIGDGHSNDTFAVEGLDLILRSAPPSGGLMVEYDIARQYEILASVGRTATDIPTPQVFGLCTDESAIGRPYFLMTRADGGSTDWKAPDWMVEGGPALRNRLSHSWISAVSKIHELPAETIGTPVRTVPDEARHWRDLAVRSRGSTELIDILDDLAQNPPPTSGPPTCVHGDPKFANFLWTPDGTLTAVLDWEFAHVGEPLVDLGYLLGLWPAYSGEPGQMPYTALEGWWDRNAIISRWQDVTGRTAHGIDRYELLGMAQIAAIFARGIDLFRSGQNSDPRLGRWERSLESWMVNLRHRNRTSTGEHRGKDLS